MASPVRGTHIEGIGEVSWLVLGTAQVGLAGADLPASAWFRLWDDAFERGVRAFDGAFHYGERSEELLGRWLRTRRAREDVVLLHKVAHTPACTPAAVRTQLEASLRRLGTDRVDGLLLHRDDPAVPAAAFAEALAAELAAGRARAAGVSNWATERIAELAASLRVALVSNQLSLAEPAEPVWQGCLRADTAWHERTGTPLLAWSAQARGFFAGRPEDAELRRCWLTPGNLERRRRAEELAAARGVTPVAVALAWVLAQPHPALCAVGALTTDALDACAAAERVALGEGERAWLAG